jgi:flavin-dependent dehydrogenase
MYDAIVVGARVAGAPTAMLLARKGYRVLLVDRATFPSDIMSTHYIHQPGVAALGRWGVLDAVVASNCPPIRTITVDVGFFSGTVPVPPLGEVDATYCPRRTVLDKILVDAAVAAGAELREGFSVQELLAEDGTVTGIRGRAAARRGRAVSGPPVAERARIVVGADGIHSLVARTVKPKRYHAYPPLGCGYYAYWSGVPLQGIELYLRDRRGILLFPTNDELTCIAMEWPNAEFHAFRADIEGNFMHTLAATSPALAARVRAGRRAERFIGTGDLPNYFRTPYGPGWALVGDAGYHKDPITGWGITDAFRDAELLAEAIDAGFSGRAPLAQALAGYQRRRDEASRSTYELTCELAMFGPPTPELLGRFASSVQPRTA